jgi:hypothetical protein
MKLNVLAKHSSRSYDITPITNVTRSFLTRP